jgi:LmeA-like phospholipid-binding
MSSDQTQPVPEWWKQPQDPKRKQENQGPQKEPGNQGYQGDPGYQGVQGDQGYQGDQGRRGNQDYQGGQDYRGNQDYQKTQDFRVNQGHQEPQVTQRLPVDQGFQAGQGPPAGQGYQAEQGFPASQGFPDGQGYQAEQDYPGNQGYQGSQGSQGTQRYPTDQGYPAAQAYQGSAPPPRRRRRRWPLITLIVIILVLVIADRAANAFTEDQMASQIQSSLALSGKPHVTIEGFPFLTQLAARDFRTVNISASNEKAGTGGLLEIASLTATLHGMHIHGTNSATVDQFNASALVTFTALANAGGVPEGITLSADGPDKIKASLDLGPLSESATAQITKTGPGQINIKVVRASGITSAILGGLNFNVNIPKLPAGVSIQSISVTQQGLQINVTGQNVTLSQ